jgi:hypothetical protein
MSKLRRPELEKDNPAAPQIYVGPRRRRAMLRAGSAASVPVQGGMAEVLRTLTIAAECFAVNVPPSKELYEERRALLDAIGQAQLLLSDESPSPKRINKK